MNDKTYSDVEKALVQFVMSMGCLKEDYLATVYNKLKADYSNSSLPDETVESIKSRTLDESLELINARLHRIHYEIARSRAQGSQETYYTFINTVPDSAAKISTQNTPKEIEIVKKMVETIITDNDEDEKYLIGSREALKFCAAEGFTSTQGQQYLNKLVHEGWFNFSRGGKYTLSLRALAELKRSLIEQYGVKNFENNEGYISLCHGCHEIVTLGVRCPNVTCNARFHRECQQDYARAKGSDCPNPNCTIDWSNERPLPVGEAALKHRAVD